VKSRTRNVVIALAWAAMSWAGYAQDPGQSQHSWGCSSTDAESTFSADLSHPSSAFSLAALKTEPVADKNGAASYHTVYSKIDVDKYGSSRIDFYVRQAKAETEGMFPQGQLDVFLKVTSPQGLSWWRLVETGKDRPGEDSLLLASPPSEEAPSRRSPVSILPGAGDRTVPIFDLQWVSHSGGTWTVDREVHVMLDLRTAQPRVAADLSCNSITAFGVCGVWDAQQQPRNTYSCDWNPAVNDFDCERTDFHILRGAKSRFRLLADKELPFPVESGQPTTLQEFAEMADRDPAWRERQVDLPGLGKTSHILRYAAGDKAMVHLFGTYGARNDFGARFYYVITTEKYQPELGYIPTLPPFSDDPEDKIRNQELAEQKKIDESSDSRPGFVLSQIFTGGALRFSVKPLHAEPGTHVFQVTATEGEGDGKRHAVYWLAIDEKQPDGKILLDMYSLANDGSTYAGCAEYMTAASAAGFKIEHGQKFRARIDVEPSHRTSEAAEGFAPLDADRGDAAEQQCAYTVELVWDHSDWQSKEIDGPCIFKPREIKIADDGTLSSKPGVIWSPDQR
jgi:hypothetical protein